MTNQNKTDKTGEWGHFQCIQPSLSGCADKKKKKLFKDKWDKLLVICLKFNLPTNINYPPQQKSKLIVPSPALCQRNHKKYEETYFIIDPIDFELSITK